MSQIFGYFFSVIGLIGALAWATGGYAQTTNNPPPNNNPPAEDTVDKPKPAKVKYGWKLRGVRLGTNLLPVLNPLFNLPTQLYEINGEWIFGKKRIIETTIGFADTRRGSVDSVFRYSNTGLFVRTGIHLNLLQTRKNFKDKEMDKTLDGMFFHAVLGMAYFNQNVQATLYDPYWGQISLNRVNPNLLAFWTEIGLGARIEAFRNFFLGVSAGIRIRLYQPRLATVNVGDIPGYGPNNAGYSFRAGFYLMYFLPFERRSK